MLPLVILAALQWYLLVYMFTTVPLSIPFYALDPPIYTFLPNTPSTVHVLEGDDFVFYLVLDANPTPTNFNWSRNGQVISSGGQIATSVSTINITSTSRSDSGWYSVASANSVGTAAISFPLDVQCELYVTND